MKLPQFPEKIIIQNKKYSLIQFENIPYKAINIRYIFLNHQNILWDIHQDTSKKGRILIKNILNKKIKI
jgi:hypothetical protein